MGRPGARDSAAGGRTPSRRTPGSGRSISRTLATAPIGPYQLQAALAAVHDEAARAEHTDWEQILGLYDLLRTLAPGPMVTLNRIVAVAMVHGSKTGLRELAAIERDPALCGNHRVD